MHDRKRQYKPNDYNVQCEENDEQIAKNKTHTYTRLHTQKHKHSEYIFFKKRNSICKRSVQKMF